MRNGPGTDYGRLVAVAQVESEAIDEIDCDAGTSRMFVRFAHGEWYTYFAVPASIYEAFIAAESRGRFFHEHIRDRYPYRRGR
jgi:uncharacterized protein YraI